MKRSWFFLAAFLFALAVPAPALGQRWELGIDVASLGHAPAGDDLQDRETVKRGPFAAGRLGLFLSPRVEVEAVMGALWLERDVPAHAALGLTLNTRSGVFLTGGGGLLRESDHEVYGFVGLGARALEGSPFQPRVQATLAYADATGTHRSGVRFALSAGVSFLVR